jgi:EAL domain-containing protein (putative c-di-GMP-specific phosphodiesterase class I)
MLMPAMILIVFTCLLCFWFQADCRRILARPFAREYFQPIVTVHRFEFLLVRNTSGNFAQPTEFSRITAALRCDFLGLTYLLKHTANFNQSYSSEELRLMLYFRVLLVLLTARHWLRWREESVLVRLTSILLYLANVIGERVNRIRYENLAA